MHTPFPAIVIGGPPHSGKSVLIHNLTFALRQQQIAHYVLRANPDGEGDWANEADQKHIQSIREKGRYTQKFIDRAVRDLQKRPLPFLVDVGGEPRKYQEAIFTHCTYGILLIADNKQSKRQWWLDLYERHNVTLVADIASNLEGRDTIDQQTSVLTASISGLERQDNRAARIESSSFKALVNTIADLLPFSETLMETKHLQEAPVSDTLTDRQLAEPLGLTGRLFWEPKHLTEFHEALYASEQSAYYGRGTVWMYGYLAAHIDTLWQFDARLGWREPVETKWKDGSIFEPEWVEIVTSHRDYSILKLLTSSDYLDYEASNVYQIGRMNNQKGVVLYGKLPFWLVTGVVKLLKTEHPWVACYQPQLKGAVVVTSRNPRYPVGKFIPITSELQASNLGA